MKKFVSQQNNSSSLPCQGIPTLGWSKHLAFAELGGRESMCVYVNWFHFYFFLFLLFVYFYTCRIKCLQLQWREASACSHKTINYQFKKISFLCQKDYEFKRELLFLECKRIMFYCLPEVLSWKLFTGLRSVIRVTLLPVDTKKRDTYMVFAHWSREKYVSTDSTFQFYWLLVFCIAIENVDFFSSPKQT